MQHWKEVDEVKEQQQEEAEKMCEVIISASFSWNNMKIRFLGDKEACWGGARCRETIQWGFSSSQAKNKHVNFTLHMIHIPHQQHEADLFLWWKVTSQLMETCFRESQEKVQSNKDTSNEAFEAAEELVIHDLGIDLHHQ